MSCLMKDRCVYSELLALLTQTKLLRTAGQLFLTGVDERVSMQDMPGPGCLMFADMLIQLAYTKRISW